jgi:hypothetical protein
MPERERVECKQVLFEKIATELNVSDVFTTPLGQDLFKGIEVV